MQFDIAVDDAVLLVQVADGRYNLLHEVPNLGFGKASVLALPEQAIHAALAA